MTFSWFETVSKEKKKEKVYQTFKVFQEVNAFIIAKSL